tara:strand:- start:1483 stop:1776 length:294 start_codon:yes stop_codon:yes gene_type:complete
MSNFSPKEQSSKDYYKFKNYLKKSREAKKLSQNDLAKELGFEYYTFISQCETGAVRIPPKVMKAWAKAIDIPLEEFCKTLLKQYHPEFYTGIFNPSA